MRRLIGIAALFFVMVLVWRMGNMLSPDAVGMGVGLIFGTLAGIPTALLLLAGQHQRGDRYYEGYNDGKRDVEDLRLNRRPEWAQPQQSTQHAMVVVANAPTVVNIDNRAINNHVYTPAHPFALSAPQAALVGEVVDDEDDEDDDIEPYYNPGDLDGWRQQLENERRFRVAGATAIYKGPVG